MTGSGLADDIRRLRGEREATRSDAIAGRGPVAGTSPGLL